MKLTADEKEQYATDNFRYIHYFTKKYHKSPWNYDDLFGAASLGMTQALNTFDTEKGIKFSTYSARCIINEIFMFMRRERKHQNNVSIDQPISEDGYGHKLSLLDTLISPEIELDWREISPVVNAVLNKLSGKKRIVMDLFFENKTQREIGEIVGISQSYVARIVGKILKKIKVEFWKGENQMAKITQEEYQHLKAQEKSDKEIATMNNLHPNYLSVLKKKWNEASNKPVMEPEKQSMTETLPTENNTNSAEYERLIAVLRNDLNVYHVQLEEKDQQIRNQAETITSHSFTIEKLNYELSELKEICEEQGSEILSMKQPAETKELEMLYKENNLLRQLLKLWM